MMAVADIKDNKADDEGMIGFRAGPRNKKLARILAAQQDMDLTAFMNDLLQKAIEAQWPEVEEQDYMLGQRPRKKARRQRPGEDNAEDRAA